MYCTLCKHDWHEDEKHLHGEGICVNACSYCREGVWHISELCLNKPVHQGPGSKYGKGDTHVEKRGTPPQTT